MLGKAAPLMDDDLHKILGEHGSLADNYTLYHVVRVLQQAIADYKRYYIEHLSPLFKCVAADLQQLIERRQIAYIHRFAAYDRHLKRLMQRIQSVIHTIATHQHEENDRKDDLTESPQYDLLMSMVSVLVKHTPHHYRDYHGSKQMNQPIDLHRRNQRLFKQAVRLQTQYHALVKQHRLLCKLVDNCKESLTALCYTWRENLELSIRDNQRFEENMAYLEGLEQQLRRIKQSQEKLQHSFGEQQVEKPSDIAETLVQRYHLYPQQGPNPYAELHYGMRTVPPN